MICCQVTIQPFAAEAITHIPWTGDRPTVSVAYLQPDGTLLVSGVMTQIDFQPTEFIIDHGGQASGVIKILQ